MIKLVQLNNSDFDLLERWYSQNYQNILRRKYRLNTPQLTKTLFSFLMSDSRNTKIIWYDQIRIGFCYTKYVDDKFIHSCYIRPEKLKYVKIIDIIKLLHKDSNIYFNKKYEFSSSFLQAIKNNQEIEISLFKKYKDIINIIYSNKI